MNFDPTTALILGICGLIGLVTWIWLIVLAFKKSVSWGLFVLLAPFLLGFITVMVASTAMAAGGGTSLMYIITAATMLPFLVFGFKYFREVKIPLVLYILVNITSAYYTNDMMNSLGMNEMMAIQQDLISGKITEEEAQQRMLEWAEKLEQSGMLSEQDQRDLRAMRELSEQNQQTGNRTPDFVPRADEENEADKYDTYAEAEKRQKESQRRLREKLAARAKDKSRYQIKENKPSYFKVSFFKIKNYVGREVKITGTNGAVHIGTLTKVLDGENRLIMSKSVKNGRFDFTLHRSDIKLILVRK